LVTHCEALTGTGRGSPSEPLRAIPKAEPVGAAGADDIAGRGASAATTGRAAAGTGRTGGAASAIAGCGIGGGGLRSCSRSGGCSRSG
jgi:hypothetical protein